LQAIDKKQDTRSNLKDFNNLNEIKTGDSGIKPDEK
jgi:hypothetical protein